MFLYVCVCKSVFDEMPCFQRSLSFYDKFSAINFSSFLTSCSQVFRIFFAKI